MSKGVGGGSLGPPLYLLTHMTGDREKQATQAVLKDR